MDFLFRHVLSYFIFFPFILIILVAKFYSSVNAPSPLYMYIHFLCLLTYLLCYLYGPLRPFSTHFDPVGLLLYFLCYTPRFASQLNLFSLSFSVVCFYVSLGLTRFLLSSGTKFGAFEIVTSFPAIHGLSSSKCF